MSEQSKELVDRWTARCECYNEHNSSSGRCQSRNVSERMLATAPSNASVYCADCAKNCPQRSCVWVIRAHHALQSGEGGK